VAKVGTSNSDRTISLTLQCVVKEHNIQIRDYKLTSNEYAFFDNKSLLVTISYSKTTYEL